jgi:hypothetical protein
MLTAGLAPGWAPRGAGKVDKPTVIASAAKSKPKGVPILMAPLSFVRPADRT